MSGKRERWEAVKVTIIETRFVTAEPAQFKSVVQRLTGKGSQTAGEEAAAEKRRALKRRKQQGVEEIGGDRWRGEWPEKFVLPQVGVAEESGTLKPMEPCLEELYELCAY